MRFKSNFPYKTLYIKILCWILVAISFTNTSVGQSNDEWMAKENKAILKTMKLIYKKPLDFKEVNGVECFDHIPKLAEIITCAGNQLHSNDEQFIAFIPIYRPLTEKDSADYSKIFPNANLDVIDKVQDYVIRGAIKQTYGHEASTHWHNYAQYYSSNDAKQKFNADTAIRLMIKLNSNEYYEGKYKYLEALFLQKKGRGYINFFCFYTDRAKKELAKYWQAIEGVFQYEN